MGLNLFVPAEALSDDRVLQVPKVNVPEPSHVTAPTSTLLLATGRSRHAVRTLGSRGAVALRDGKILLRQKAPVGLTDPVDPTGAGDAFAAGFLHGIHSSSGSTNDNNSSCC